MRRPLTSCRFRPRQEFERAEFIEFAVGDAAASELIALIEGLGFQCAGRHRSKDVDLYTQGKINLEQYPNGLNWRGDSRIG